MEKHSRLAYEASSLVENSHVDARLSLFARERKGEHVLEQFSGGDRILRLPSDRQ